MLFANVSRPIIDHSRSPVAHRFDPFGIRRGCSARQGCAFGRWRQLGGLLATPFRRSNQLTASHHRDRRVSTQRRRCLVSKIKDTVEKLEFLRQSQFQRSWAEFKKKALGIRQRSCLNSAVVVGEFERWRSSTSTAIAKCSAPAGRSDQQACRDAATSPRHIGVALSRRFVLAVPRAFR
jgi:hypothetical protein